MTKRIAFRIILLVAALIIGFVLLLRSCLSKFDERSALGSGGGSSQSASQFLVFEKDGKGVIVSLIKYDKTVSYSQKGGSVNKSVNTTYYVQTNDLVTAAKTGIQKIKTHGQIKAYPVEIIGAAGNKAWLFAGELMAFDPFTLSKLVDVVILEEKNPFLKGKLINERRYYNFDDATQEIHFTAADGVKYLLNTTTLIATALDESNTKNNTASRTKELNKQSSQLREQKKAAYDRLRENNRLYREKQLSLRQYQDSTAIIETETRRLGQLLDSMERLINETRNAERTDDDTQRRKEHARRTGSGFGGMRVNGDTMHGQWYGLYTNDEITRLNQRFDYHSLNDDAARNKLYTAPLIRKDDDWIIAEEKQPVGTAIYLQSGFLLSKESGLPLHVAGDFLLVHKDIIGRDGKVQLTRIHPNGEQVWTIQTGLKEFYDWQQKGNTLVITGTDNKDLSTGEVNLLLVINLQSGAVAGYDYFTDKVRVMK